jgi:hypothetical protein
MDSNRMSVVSGVSNTERFPNSCSLQVDLHSQRACHLHSAPAHPTTQLKGA